MRVGFRLLVSLSPLLLVCLTLGCSTQQKVVYSPVNTTPIVGDEAIALRSDWPKSYSHYANGGVNAYSTRFPYDVNVGHPLAGTVILEPALFIAQVGILPLEVVANPPFEEQIWHGEVLPPTYTAQPPLPPPGGAPVQAVMPYPFLGPQATTPDVGLPGAPAAPTGGTQLPAYPAVSIPAAPAPMPPPGAPGGVSGPPVTR
jgi:hypothetical protein